MARPTDFETRPEDSNFRSFGFRRATTTSAATRVPRSATTAHATSCDEKADDPRRWPFRRGNGRKVRENPDAPPVASRMRSPCKSAEAQRARAPVGSRDCSVLAGLPAPATASGFMPVGTSAASQYRRSTSASRHVAAWSVHPHTGVQVKSYSRRLCTILTLGLTRSSQATPRPVREHKKTPP